MPDHRPDLTYITSPRLDAELPERFAALEALASEHVADAPQAKVFWLICDACGRRIVVGPADPAPDGWRMTITGDYCPGCHA